MTDRLDPPGALAAEAWPTFAAAAGPGPAAGPSTATATSTSTGPATSTRASGGVAVVWRGELTKLSGQLRVRVAAGVCAVGPLLVVLAFGIQQATPGDTLFGQWIHESGWAVPLVVLAWSGQWVLPALTAIVAGDIFSSEDHLGTWKTVLTRSRGRGQIFAGKVLAALTYAVGMVAILTASSVVAGALGGSHPLVGLGGQTVPAGHAAELVALSWGTQVLPVVAFTALAVACSVLARNSVVGIGGPVLLGLVLQLTSLIDLPLSVRHWLITTPFGSWLGFWTQPSFAGPVIRAVPTSAVWAAVSLAVAWAVFRSRDIGAA